MRLRMEGTRCRPGKACSMRCKSSSSGRMSERTFRSNSPDRLKAESIGAGPARARPGHQGAEARRRAGAGLEPPPMRKPKKQQKPLKRVNAARDELMPYAL